MARIALTLCAGALSAALSLAAPNPARAAGDPAMGGRLFLQCRACHTVGPADNSGVGPNLNGVVGAKAASRAGYSYSPALAKSGLVWNPATLDAFLTKPSALVPGTKMPFAGVASAQARADLIAYLATLTGAKR
jgi:cytochrome c